MKSLTIHNNLCYLPQIIDIYDKVYFSPKMSSKPQKDFFTARFLHLKTLYPQIEMSDYHSPVPSDFLTWNSSEEKKLAKGSILPHQNRLFNDLQFNVPEGFSSFRKKAEKLLPDFYEEAIAPTDPAVIDRLSYFFEQHQLASNYFETRNGLVGSNYSTQLSQFLSCGALDVRYLYNYVKKYEQEFGDNKSTYWIIFELLWREFFYWHYQKHENLYFSENGLRGEKNFSSFPTYTFKDLHQLESPSFFKAALHELEQTGFLSNRVRQIFASIWINDLNLAWRSGALLFEENLIDYDVYSNYGNWMYLAGVGVDPRGRRYFNLEKQMAMYDPHWSYEKKWLQN